MNIANRISINTRYTRSINVERDRESDSVVAAYIPTSRGLGLLKDVAQALQPVDQPRAWSLIGPYGSGKSSFALFLNQLLADSRSSAGQTALTVLERESVELAAVFSQQRTWCRVMLSGSAEPLSTRLITALDVAAQSLWSAKRGRKPVVLKDLASARKTKPTTNEILELFSAVQDAIEKQEGSGLLVVIDELGKFLEYEARHYGANDIFLLQGLAERAYTGRRANTLLFVMLHQGFDLYARGLGENLKNDWAKVQGRFENVPFVESTEQTLRVVASAFSNDLSPSQSKSVRHRSLVIAKTLSSAGALPGLMKEKEAENLFARCYPLHPVALLSLPLLCQKFAQNERTLFSYLGSQEPHGFQRSLSLLDDTDDWIDPSEVYDYFIENQPAVLADPLTHRRWAEVVTAVERAQSLGPTPERLAKSIGLLNLISSSDGLKASREVIDCLFEDSKAAGNELKALVATSVVQYRKFSHEYRVWQGTDFNIEEATHLESEKLGNFELAPTLAERIQTAPIVARRHSIRTGALRYFEVAYLDARSYGRYANSDVNPRIAFFLSEGQDDERIFEEIRGQAFSPVDIAVLYRNGSDIRAAIREVLALEGVQRSAQELASDPVASRELKERLKSARIAEQDILETLTGNPSLSEWYWRGEKQNIGDRRALQVLMSKAMDQIYDRSPIIKNELINRERLSSQAAAARNKLFQLMLEAADQAGLGIEKYPPEKSVYRSIFEATKLHCRIDGRWQFVAPLAADSLNLRGAWDEIEQFFAETEGSPQAISVLMERLAAPPFGVKRGVFPLLFLHYYLVYGHEIALYEEGLYAPFLTYEHIERLVRKPEQYSFQRFRIEGVRASLFAEYSKALFGHSQQSVDILGIARPLSKFMLELDDYAKSTRRLSEESTRIRQAFFLSKSPEKLLFQELPKACGFTTTSDFSGFSKKLIACLRELNQAHVMLLSDMRMAICDAFGIASDTELSELRPLLRGRCHGLDQYTVDIKGLKSFIRRVSDRTGDDDEWLKGLLLFLGHKPTQKWNDQDRDTADYRLSQFSRRLLDLEKLRLHHESNVGADVGLDVLLIKVLRKGGEEIDEVVSLNERTRAAIAQSRSQIEEVIFNLQDKELRLALIAEITHQVLSDYRTSLKKSSAPEQEDDTQHVG